MSEKRLTVDELLAEQAAPDALLATVERFEDKAQDDYVKVTPWARSGGCRCHLTLRIKKSSIEGATPTGDTHVCCGKALKVVELHFRLKDSIALDDLFRQLVASTEHTHLVDERAVLSTPS